MGTRYDRTILGSNDDGRRVDRILRRLLQDVPLSRIYRAMRSGEITVNGRRVRGDTRVSEGDAIELAESLHGRRTVDRTGVPDGRTGGDGSSLSRRIVHEDNDLLVVNKRRGELTHGAGSLETAVHAYLAGRPTDGVSFRPGPVHRLDRNTSGLLVFSLSLRGAQAAAAAFRDGTIGKRYVALFEGTLTAGTWDDLLGRDRAQRVTRRVEGTASDTGLRAVSKVEPIAASATHTLGLVRITTGRTHQIRAQAGIHGHPLAGDRKYGSTEAGPYLLHAASLTVAQPHEGIGFSYLYADIPDSFRTRVEEHFGTHALQRLDAILRGRHNPEASQ